MFNIYYSFYGGGSFNLVDEKMVEEHNDWLEKHSANLSFYNVYYPEVSLEKLATMLTDAEKITEYDASSSHKLSKMFKEAGLLIDTSKHSKEEVKESCKNLAKLLRNLYCNLGFDYKLPKDDEPLKGDSGVWLLKYNEAHSQLKLNKENGKSVISLELGLDENKVQLKTTEADTFFAVKALDDIVAKLKEGTATLDEVKKFNNNLTEDQLKNITKIVKVGLSDEVTESVNYRFEEDCTV